jgi:opacity protein-like surface antigen
MKKGSLWCVPALGALMFGTMGSAKADDHGFYADLGAGITAYPGDVNGYLNGVRFKHDGHTSDFTYSFAVGYRINRYVGVEAGFVDMGNPVVDLQDPADSKKKVGRERFSVQGKTLAVLMHLPTGDLDSFVRLGAIQAQYGTRHYLREGMFVTEYFATRERTSLLVGLGTRYAFSQQWAMSLSVDYYDNVGGGGDGPNLVSPRVGVSYRF